MVVVVGGVSQNNYAKLSKTYKDIIYFMVDATYIPGFHCTIFFLGFEKNSNKKSNN